MLIDPPVDISTVFPTEEVRQYNNEGSPFPTGWFPKDSVFSLKNEGFIVVENSNSPTSSNYNRIFISSSSPSFTKRY